ncbi:MAG: FxLYD domain-containing protein [Haloferacaceae archaeon]
MDRRAFLAATGTALAGCSTGRSESATVPDSLDFDVTKTPSAADVVAFRNPAWTRLNEKNYAAQGTVENRGDERLARIRIDADFLDADGNLVTQLWTSARFLEPGERYRFTIPVSGAAGLSRCRYRVTARRDPSVPENDGQVAVESAEWQSFNGDAAYGLDGRLRNVSDSFLERVYVYGNFYAGDELLAWWKDGTADLKADATYDWRVPFKGDDPDAVEDWTTTVLVREQ